MNSVERVKSICKARKIPISKLEKELGFSNGYIGQLRKGTFPADRLDAIANYLLVSAEYLLYGDSQNIMDLFSGNGSSSDEQKNKPTAEGGFTDDQLKLIEFSKTVPASKADLLYRVMLSILEDA